MDSSFILSLIDKFNAGAVTDLEFNDGVKHLILRKGGEGKSVSQIVQRDSDAMLSGAVLGNAPEKKAAIVAMDNVQSAPVTSPIVATFYSAPSPDVPPFVTPGSKVKTGETLCILEAMKMMNKLEAEFDMEILSVEAKDGDLVEFGQTLFKVKAV
ncbi:MAG: acetyl-CoA carboxylase biotin carboxyl carrier protein [Treponema sp.]|jgi:acetyl-CoA carboxylase biotin carboxyl carrier protein|nr:acetyl-CoA carboxylase biotin carboxyl carrier protein [Treponema sp.]